jgi:hypothetical protein
MSCLSIMVDRRASGKKISDDQWQRHFILPAKKARIVNNYQTSRVIFAFAKS